MRWLLSVILFSCCWLANADDKEVLKEFYKSEIGKDILVNQYLAFPYSEDDIKLWIGVVDYCVDNVWSDKELLSLGKLSIQDEIYGLASESTEGLVDKTIRNSGSLDTLAPFMTGSALKLLRPTSQGTIVVKALHKSFQNSPTYKKLMRIFETNLKSDKQKVGLVMLCGMTDLTAAIFGYNGGIASELIDTTLANIRVKSLKSLQDKAKELENIK